LYIIAENVVIKHFSCFFL